MKKYRLYVGTIFYVVAVVVANLFSIKINLLIAVVLFCSAIIISLLLRSRIKIGGLILFFLCLGFTRMIFFHVYEYSHEFDFDTENKEHIFRVVDLPHRAGRSVDATLVSENGTRVSLSASTYTELLYGDSVKVVGAIKPIPKPSYLKDKIFFKLSSRNIKVLSHGGNKFIGMLYDIRIYFLKTTYRIYPSPHGELVTGLTVEGSDAISKELKEKFRITGLSHIVALSGTNVSIIIQAVAVLLKRTRRSVRFSTICFFILAFAIMTGLSSTIMRASIMSLMSIAADASRRRTNALRGLTFSLLLMSLWNPYTPIYDISFQLSFIATLSMIVVEPVVEYFIRFIKYETLRETLATTLAAEILVTPMILYYSGMFSVIAPLCNILVVPIIPLAMFFGTLPFVVSFAGIIAHVVSLPGYILTSYIFFIVNYFSKLSFASYEIHISIPTLIGVYIVIAALLRYTYKKLGMKLKL